MKSEFDDVLAIIPARAGSKRLPGKNKAIFEGIPLWLNTVNIAKGAGIKNIIVSTDDEEILSTKVEGVMMLERSKQNATDEAKTEDVIYEVINFTEAAGLKYKTICLLQPTSPLLQTSTLIHALHIFHDKNLVCLVAVNRMMKPAGAFYIFSYIEFLFNRTIWMQWLSVYVLNEKESIDIDDIWDWRIANSILENKVYGRV